MASRQQKFWTFTLLSASLLLTNCRKDIGMEQREIMPGQVQFVVKNGVALKNIYSVILNQGLESYELRNFYYTKVIAAGSSVYYFNIFKSQPYIIAFDIAKNPNDTFSQFRNVVFKDLRDSNFKIWDSIVYKENLIEMPETSEGDKRTGIVYISPGQEKIWIERLKLLPEIENADFVYVVKYICR